MYADTAELITRYCHQIKR